MNLLSRLLARAGYLNRLAHSTNPEIALRAGLPRIDPAQSSAWLDMHVQQYANLAIMHNAVDFAPRHDLKPEFQV
jgi:hypothetical protein